MSDDSSGSAVRFLNFALTLSGLALVAGATSVPSQTANPIVQPGVASAKLELPGRDLDGRAARIAFRLATSGVKHCAATQPVLGMVLQHLLQFELSDRPSLSADAALNRGPGVVVVVPGSPAHAAGILAGDVLFAIDGVALPHEEGLDLPFSAPRAHARADMIQTLIEREGTSTLTLLRGDTTITARVTPAPACPSRVHLARSAQRNAYADGVHVFLTTGLVSQLNGDDELAFVIAHEMAHNILGHAAVMRGGGVRKGLGRGLGDSGRIVRAAEDAADALGGELMLDVGFDPVRGAGLLRRFGGGGLSLFGTHASAGVRIARMQALVQARSAS